jgi:hypothetical protein
MLLTLLHPTLRFYRLFGFYLVEMVTPSIVVYAVYVNIQTMLNIWRKKPRNNEKINYSNPSLK